MKSSGNEAGGSFEWSGQKGMQTGVKEQGKTVLLISITHSTRQHQSTFTTIFFCGGVLTLEQLTQNTPDQWVMDAAKWHAGNKGQH